jgi:GntR family transcriptional regulator
LAIKGQELNIINGMDYGQTGILISIFSIYFGIVLPLYYKFGYQKVRWLMLVATIISGAATSALSKIGPVLNQPLFMFFAAIIGAVIYYFSFTISVNIFENENWWWGEQLDIIIANSLDKPIYMQIKEQVIDQIIKEELKPGEMLPSIRALAKELRISVITTKRAYEELERDGYIETVVGKGTFVSGINKALIYERQMELLENDLSAVIDNAKRMKLSKQELFDLISLLWE